ncbi:TPA: aromatic hydrocarbon degradation protein [Vibrio vulnificus]|nr:outer membrane protein transport protein [Vibrio vulnificus]ELL0584722.1 outer membrane protein transport protein [Vibrio vulnificus]MCU8334682.1 outer membrane protein transport protein [Vibrio vulnificus]MCU8409972.1 outer membrane protein transport protein [Vibrio vulnificus]HAS8115384.1 aromatic hydrocarbon degradation protein [Vibrio vulnificus]
MKTNKTLLSTAVAFGLLSSANLANAAGFQLAEYSATGLGRAYAGEAAMADNASAQWRNPAMLTYLEGTQVSVGAIYVDPNIDIEGNITTVSLTGDHRGATSANDIAHSAVVPNFYLSHMYSEKWAVGFSLGTNYGMETELDSSFTATHFGDEAKVMTVEALTSLAYKVNDQLSLGAGIRYVTGEGHFGASNQVLGTLKYMEGDDSSWGYQIGAALQINDKNRIGFAYKSEVTMNFDGYATGYGFNTQNPTAKKNGSLEIILPATAEISSYSQLTEQISLHASVNWTDWSTFKELKANFKDGASDVIKTENWKDNYRFAVGATYLLDPKLTLRTGIAYDTAAVDDKYRTTTIPETDRTWLSIGASYEFTKSLTLDGGFTYILAKDAPIKEPRDESDKISSAIGGKFQGEISGDIWLIGIQANYRF